LKSKQKRIIDSNCKISFLPKNKIKEKKMSFAIENSKNIEEN
jgi:hypothetical protein